MKTREQQISPARFESALEAAGFESVYKFFEAHAAQLGVSRSALYRWAAGENAPAGAKLQALAAALRVSVPYLLGAEVSPEPVEQTPHNAVTNIVESALGLLPAQDRRALLERLLRCAG